MFFLRFYTTRQHVSELADIRMRMLDLIRLQQITYHGSGGKVLHCSADEANSRIARKATYGKWYYAPKSPDMPLLQADALWNYIYCPEVCSCGTGNLLIFLPLYLHMFRHTKAMHLVQANVNTVYIKDYLGLRRVSTTEIYACADNEAKHVALEKALYAWNYLRFELGAGR